MRTFEHYPQGGTTKCPVCNTSDDKECFLVPITGTIEDGIAEAVVVHTECMRTDQWMYDKDFNVIYMKIERARNE